MNKTAKSLGLLAAMMIISEGNTFDNSNIKPIHKDESYKKSKCKSCINWNKINKYQGCSIKDYRSPNQQACKLYKHK